VIAKTVNRGMRKTLTLYDCI